MIRNQWLDEAEADNTVVLPATTSKRKLLEAMMREHWKKVALNKCTRKDCPSCTKFKGKFQQASTKSWPGRMYPYKISEMLRGDEVSD